MGRGYGFQTNMWTPSQCCGSEIIFFFSDPDPALGLISDPDPACLTKVIRLYKIKLSDFFASVKISTADHLNFDYKKKHTVIL
jgi:hypothetical protein